MRKASRPAEEGEDVNLVEGNEECGSRPAEKGYRRPAELGEGGQSRKVTERPSRTATGVQLTVEARRERQQEASPKGEGQPSTGGQPRKATGGQPRKATGGQSRKGRGD